MPPLWSGIKGKAPALPHEVTASEGYDVADTECVGIPT